ncbi:Tim17-domain-containing protein [Hanseniaspora valbyensis NRRL Y-1626]|uniref:Tim17-domain-containing protein n=1 Tax=Hanseniaspora valbyensis NRRL Y-1626 TaxID=766949 RepID=A0A1B7TAY7_9ASCO|nr:Tim17-domain-containing protein [Hanseniaspora valbyensis NRRL Y-1626]
MSWLSGSSSTPSIASTATPSHQQTAPTNTVDSLYDAAGITDDSIDILDIQEDKLSTIEGSQSIIPSRDWRDDLCYGTGTVYGLSLVFGSAYGFFESVGKIQPGSSFKLQLNTILNNITKRGPFIGNHAGILAMNYNMINSGLDYYRNKHDDYNTLAAGALTGALFKSTKGLKPMVYASGLCTLGAGVWCGFKRVYLNSDESGNKKLE